MEALILYVRDEVMRQQGVMLQTEVHMVGDPQ
jgi:UDP-N-acetylenolpyruvoylglucosamine reductase